MAMEGSPRTQGLSVVTHHPSSLFTRRAFLGAVLGAGASAAIPFGVRAQTASGSFEAWRDAFRQRAAARGVSEATYGRVMGSLKPDTSVYAQIRPQPQSTSPPSQHTNP